MLSKSISYEKILISACFLGQKVRYNGKIKTLEHELITQWHQQGRLVSICPEVIGGLAVPRPAAEINQLSGKVIASNGIDVSKEFEQGAIKALELCQKYGIQFALLKESSPSCGSKFIYDGTFSNNKISGEGKTTKLLRENGIKVFSELTLTELASIVD